MLHTVNKSPLERNTLESCLRRANAGDVVLLIEDGVYGAMRGTVFAPRVQEALKSVRICALAPDVQARGIGDKLLESVQLVDYGGYVDLTVEHFPIMSWL